MWGEILSISEGSAFRERSEQKKERRRWEMFEKGKLILLWFARDLNNNK